MLKKTVIMHGLFDLKSEYSSLQFKLAFDDFCAHLKQEKLLISWSYMQRTPDDVYDARPPIMQFYVAMKFFDAKQAEVSKEYVIANQEPIKTLHYAVNSKVENTQFFLCEDVEERI